MLAVEGDVKYELCKVTEEGGGAINREGVFIRINTFFGSMSDGPGKCIVTITYSWLCVKHINWTNITELTK